MSNFLYAQNSRFDFTIWLPTFCSFLILATFAFGSQIFNLTLAGDGWDNFTAPVPTQYDWTISIGRYLSPLIWNFFGNNELANSWLYFYFFSAVFFYSILFFIKHNTYHQLQFLLHLLSFYLLHL